MAVTGRAAKPSEADQLRAELAETRAALHAVARVTANVAAKSARGSWTDFGKLLMEQFSVTHPDALVFLDVLAGRKP